MIPTRDTLTAGTVVVTVRPDPHWRAARALLGEEWYEEYTYRIERVDSGGGGTMYFLHALTTDKKGDNPRFVYTGVLHPILGTIRMTRASAFPITATRVMVAQKVFGAIFTRRGGDIEAANWTIEATVVKEAVGRF